MLPACLVYGLSEITDLLKIATPLSLSLSSLPSAILTMRFRQAFSIYFNLWPEPLLLLNIRYIVPNLLHYQSTFSFAVLCFCFLGCSSGELSLSGNLFPSIRVTWPNHVRLRFLTLSIIVSFKPSCCLISTFLILSIRETPSILLIQLISAANILRSSSCRRHQHFEPYKKKGMTSVSNNFAFVPTWISRSCLVGRSLLMLDRFFALYLLYSVHPPTPARRDI